MKKLNLFYFVIFFSLQFKTHDLFCVVMSGLVGTINNVWLTCGCWLFGAVSCFHRGSLLCCCCGLVCGFWTQFILNLLVLLLLSKRALWLFTFGLCFVLDLPRSLHPCSNVSLFLYMCLLLCYVWFLRLSNCVCYVRVGCVLLYTAQGKFHGSTTNTLKSLVSQADFTAENLRNVSDYLDAAQKIGVEAVFLPADVQKNIDEVQMKINSSAADLSSKTKKNSETIKDVIDAM